MRSVATERSHVKTVQQTKILNLAGAKRILKLGESVAFSTKLAFEIGGRRVVQTHAFFNPSNQTSTEDFSVFKQP